MEYLSIGDKGDLIGRMMDSLIELLLKPTKGELESGAYNLNDLNFYYGVEMLYGLLRERFNAFVNEVGEQEKCRPETIIFEIEQRLERNRTDPSNIRPNEAIRIAKEIEERALKHLGELNRRAKKAVAELRNLHPHPGCRWATPEELRQGVFGGRCDHGA